MSAQGTKSDYAAARAAMIESQLRPQGVTDRRVLDAMGCSGSQARRNHHRWTP